MGLIGFCAGPFSSGLHSVTVRVMDERLSGAVMVSRTSRLYAWCKQKSEVIQLDISVNSEKSKCEGECSAIGHLSRTIIGCGRPVKARWLSGRIVGRTTVAKLSRTNRHAYLQLTRYREIGCYALHTL